MAFFPIELHAPCGRAAIRTRISNTLNLHYLHSDQRTSKSKGRSQYQSMVIDCYIGDFGLLVAGYAFPLWPLRLVDFGNYRPARIYSLPPDFLAPAWGIEPQISDLEAAVLPLALCWYKLGQPVRLELTIAVPQTAVLPLHYGKHIWYPHKGSNLGPPACKADAHPSWAIRVF